MPKQGGQGKGKPKLKDKNFGKALIKQRLRDGIVQPKETNMISILDNSALDDYVQSSEMGGLAPEVKRVNRSNEAVLVETMPLPTVQSLSTAHFDYTHLKIPRKPSWTTSMTAEEVDRREKDSFLSWRREIARMEDNNRVLKVTPFEKNIEVWRQLWRVIERSDFAIQIVDARNPLIYYTSDLHTYAGEQSPPKPMMLLVNKADYLTEFQRREWAKHFESQGIKFAFYSAKIEQEKIDLGDADQTLPEQTKAGSVDEEQEDDVEDEEEEDDDEVLEGDDDESASESSGGDDGAAESEPESAPVSAVAASSSVEMLQNADEMLQLARDITSSWSVSHVPVAEAPAAASTVAASQAVFVWGDSSEASSIITSVVNSSTTRTDENAEQMLIRKSSILTRSQLIELLALIPVQLGLQSQARHKGRVCVGMLGYPNVGKSSVINTLLGVSKSSHDKVRVAVSSTPGKTKHFQTLVLTDTLMLCDCPGLVFPSFMNSTGEMLCAGILPINQMRDYVSPAAVIASRVPMHLLEAAYGLHIVRELDFKDNPDRPPNAHEMLTAYCRLKGLITNGTGRWDEFRACKELLRDFNDGRILFVAPPYSALTSLTEEAVGSAPHAPNAEPVNASKEYVDRWLAETEKVMMRRERVSERLAVAKLSQLADSQEASGCGGTMVFGDVRRGGGGFSASASQVREGEVDADCNSEDSSEDDGRDVDGSSQGPPLLLKREHKRLKHWGKKNKKLRDKNPYGEENGVISYVAYSTNRVQGSGKSEKEKERRRHDPRNVYGVEYTRAVLPHHQPGLSVSEPAV